MISVEENVDPMLSELVELWDLKFLMNESCASLYYAEEDYEFEFSPSMLTAESFEHIGVNMRYELLEI